MFKDSNGNIVAENKFKEACEYVAYMYRKQAIDIYNENHYASHVTANEKLDNVTKSFIVAEHIENGDIVSFKAWQDINQYITGDCVALLPK